MPSRYKRRFFDPKYVRLERRKENILACILFWSVLWFFFIRHFLFATVQVVGPSMLPNLADGDRLLLHRWVNFVGHPERGDVVAVDFGRDGDLSVKRIVGLPGERLTFSNRAVYVNGRLLTEPYLPPRTITAFTTAEAVLIEIPPGRYFVMGDNRLNSEDSRHLGPVPEEALVGRIRI